jgi:hypothetical protein
MNKYIQYKTGGVIIAAMLILPLLSHAQTNDTLAPVRQFVQLSNSVYKQLPMYAHMVIKNSSNYITGSQDTATSEAEFYISEDGAYMKYGTLEQVVNDSLMLMVNNAAQQMILLPNRQSVQQRLSAYTGMLLGDSSVQKISGIYTASTLPVENNNAVIELTSRIMAFGTSLPKEVLLMKFKEKNNEPLELTQIKRILVKLDSTQYNTLVQNPEYKGRLLSPGNGNYILVKDRITTFIYKKIAYGDKIKVPVQMSDRITQNSNGAYMPVQAYQAYLLNQQN